MVSRKRGKRKKMEQEIEMEKWERYVEELVRVEWRVRKKRGSTKGEKDEEKEINREEIDRVIKKLKKEKSAGENNMRYGSMGEKK